MKYGFYSTNELKPLGWLKKQLEIQASGLAGNLDNMWPDVQDSAWIGGKCDGWERVPYWLDGFIPLAYLLEDEGMIERAKKYVNAIMDRQKESGWICPCDEAEAATYDPWAVLLITKVLTVYYECSKDERVPEALYKALKNYYGILKDGKAKLYNWGKFRWYEGFVAINFINARYNEPWIVELAKIIRDQGVVVKDLMPTWVRPMNKWTFETHIVNICMEMKTEAITHAILGEEYTDEAEMLYQHLKKYNGTPVELFTGDECLSGISPIQGTELCSVVELMYSYEHLYAATGDNKWAERLEKIAFNALPATISDDMWRHQYVQLSNQMACITFPGKSLFRTNTPDAHTFGLEPAYGCCTANFGQGWPKFALSAFMQDGNDIVSVLPIPSVLNDGGVKIALKTNYPFENVLTYEISADRDFGFKVRIPHFAENLTVNGQKSNELNPVYEIKAGTECVFEFKFDVTPKLVERPNDLTTAESGSLVFSVPITYDKKMLEYERGGVVRKYPYCDYELIPTSEWQYGYASDVLTREAKGVSDVPFSSEKPPVTLHAKVKRIEWGFEDGYDCAASKLPLSREPISEEIDIELHPYGCSKLRMTELPKV